MCEEKKCQRCGGTEDVKPVHRFGADVPTLLCKKCDDDYLREKDEFYDRARAMGQED